MRGRAIRRHQMAVAKARARRYLTSWELPLEPRSVGIYANTRALCSCWMCGNPRHYLGQRRRQEILANTDPQAELDSHEVRSCPLS